MAAELDPIEERKARLQALRLAAELSATPEENSEDGESRAVAEAELQPTIKFRNYVPRDEQLQNLKIVPPEPLKFIDPLARAPEDINGMEDPIVSIAPKKANWDLRRDVAKKLEKLERRTQRSIIELMQEEEKRRQATGEDGDDGID